MKCLVLFALAVYAALFLVRATAEASPPSSLLAMSRIRAGSLGGNSPGASLGGNSTVSATSTKKSIARIAKVATKRTKTIADISKRRSELVKITRQKSDGKQILTVSPLCVRVLRRLSSSKQEDGVALLLGHEDTRTPVAANKAKSIVRKSTSSATTAVEQKDIKNTHVACVCELYSEDGGKSYSNLFSVLELSSALNLTVVGCAVGSCDGAIWGTGHIKAALQLHHLLKNASDLVVLSVFEQPPAEEGLVAADKKKGQRKRPSATVDDQGLTLEAFSLSGQAWTLFKRGVLDASCCAAGAGARSKGADPALVQLNSEVLLRSDETTTVEPALLSVPVPVKLATGAVDFEHYFPTQQELLRDQKASGMAKKHLLRQLGRLGTTGIKSVLRDPHLLLYISGSLGVDKTSFLALCKSLREPGDALSSGVKMVLESSKLVLESSLKVGESDEEEEKKEL